MTKRWGFAWKTQALTVLAAVWVAGAAVPAAAQTTASRQVTFTRDIAPILQRSCQRCHRPNSVAPMSLLTYEESRPFARAMKQRTAMRDAPWGRGAMPPWFVERNLGVQRFKEDPSLSDEEIALFAAWADNGAPQGNPADMPPPLKFAGDAEWALGTPDLIVSSPSVFVPAVRSDWTGTVGVSAPVALAEDRYTASSEFMEVPETDLKGMTFGSLGGRFVFHHAELRDADREQGDAAPTTPLVMAPHEVGRNGEVYPQEAGLFLKAGVRIAWNMHIHSMGVDRKAHLDLGYKLHPRGYAPKYRIRRVGSNTTQIQVDPNLPNQRMETYWIAPEHVKVLNFEPHLHATGVRMCLRAIMGSVIETLSCVGYDHNWVRNYQYDDNATPLLPKGTILQAIAWFDNTPVNKNVLEPRNLSRFGFTSVSNMFTNFNTGIQLTEEQYQEELTKRREYLRLTGEEIIGCPDCYDKAAPPNYLPAAAATGGAQ